MTPATITYQTETCGRCGGSGHYSYNSMHGTVCYGCSGRKVRLSKAGAKASAAVKAFIAANFSVPVESLKAGDRIMYEGKARTVASVTTDGSARYGIGTATDGSPIWADYVSVTFTKPIASQFGPVGNHGFCQGTMVVKAVTGADWEAVVAFARTLKKGVLFGEREQVTAQAGAVQS